MEERRRRRYTEPVAEERERQREREREDRERDRDRRRERRPDRPRDRSPGRSRDRSPTRSRDRRYDDRDRRRPRSPRYSRRRSRSSSLSRDSGSLYHDNYWIFTPSAPLFIDPSRLLNCIGDSRLTTPINYYYTDNNTLIHQRVYLVFWWLCRCIFFSIPLWWLPIHNRFWI